MCMKKNVTEISTPTPSKRNVILIYCYALLCLAEYCIIDGPMAVLAEFTRKVKFFAKF